MMNMSNGKTINVLPFEHDLVWFFKLFVLYNIQEKNILGRRGIYEIPCNDRKRNYVF